VARADREGVLVESAGRGPRCRIVRIFARYENNVVAIFGLTFLNPFASRWHIGPWIASSGVPPETHDCGAPVRGIVGTDVGELLRARTWWKAEDSDETSAGHSRCDAAGMATRHVADPPATAAVEQHRSDPRGGSVGVPQPNGVYPTFLRTADGHDLVVVGSAGCTTRSVGDKQKGTTMAWVMNRKRFL